MLKSSWFLCDFLSDISLFLFFLEIIFSWKFFFFVYFLSFLFNFVSMDYSPYVIKASDGSFKKAHVNMFRSRDDSTDCPCVFDLFRISEIMWILHKKKLFYDVIKMHPELRWTLPGNSSEWCWKKNRGLWEIKGHKSLENFYNGPMTAQRSNYRSQWGWNIFAAKKFDPFLPVRFQTSCLGSLKTMKMIEKGWKSSPESPHWGVHMGWISTTPYGPRTVACLNSESHPSGLKSLLS